LSNLSQAIEDEDKNMLLATFSKEEFKEAIISIKAATVTV